MPYQVAGTEVYTWALAKSLQQKGHEVAIVVPNYKSSESDSYQYDGLLVNRYAEPDNKDRMLITGKRAPDGIGAFEKLIYQLKPDIVHIQELAGSSGIGIYHLRLLKKIGIKVVFTMHLARYSCFSGTLMYKDKEPCSGLIDIKRCTQCGLNKQRISNITQQFLYNISMPLYNLNISPGKTNSSFGTAFSYPFIINNLRNSLHEIVNLSEYVIVLTNWYKEVLLKNGVLENKIQLVKQALPYAIPVTPAKNLKEKKFIRLIFIGRIDPIKGLHLLIEAVGSVPEDKISLDIFGGVNNEQYYQYWKNKTKNKTNIFWKGLLEQKEVVNTISQYDALVLPSTVGEMSPLVIQEAFAAKVPVIGTDVPGIAEQVIHNYNGLLFDFNNVTSLRNILYSLIQDQTILPKLQENISEPLDFETVVEQTLAVYNK